jgi:chromosome segregation ATPase
MKRHFAGWLLVLAIAACASGCSMVPRSDLTDCAQRCRVLQAESGQLKDEVLSLRSQNRDLSQRAVDDSKRLQVLEEANRRLEDSIAAYQQDRDSIAAAFDKLQAQLRAASDTPPATASRSGP